MNEEVKIPNNIEINQALKDFEKEASIEEDKKAPEVKKTSDIPKMVELTMKFLGVEQKYAEYILLGFAILVIIVSAFLFFVRGNNEEQRKSFINKESLTFPVR